MQVHKVKVLPLVLAAFLVISAGSTFFASLTFAASEAESTADDKPSLYDQLGGEKAIDAAVDKFYEKVLADERVNGFFKGVDMDRQRAMQKAFLTFAFGGPNAYEGRDLRAAHAHLVAKGLNDTHFDVIVEHLGTTLKELDVKEDLIKHAADVANSVRSEVLNKSE